MYSWHEPQEWTENWIRLALWESANELPSLNMCGHLNILPSESFNIKMIKTKCDMTAPFIC